MVRWVGLVLRSFLSFFQDVFNSSFANFSAHPVTFWVHLLNIIACFFSIFEMNSKFIIDCWSYRCVNGEGWIEEICIKCLWCEKCLKDLGFIFIWSSNQKFHLSLLRKGRGVSTLSGFCHYILCHYVFRVWGSHREMANVIYFAGFFKSSLRKVFIPMK